MQNIFVGRVNELKTLNQLLQDTQKGLGKIVFVKAEAGGGKTAFVNKFLEDKDDCLIGTAECKFEGDSTPYYPFKHALAELKVKSLVKKDIEKARVDKFFQFIIKAGPRWFFALPYADKIATATVETMKDFQKEFDEEAATKQISGQEEIWELYEAELRALSQECPIIIWIDDIHLTGNSSLHMLYALGMRLRNNPFKLLIINTYRPHHIKRDGQYKFNNETTTVHPLQHTIDKLQSSIRFDSTKQDNLIHDINLPAFVQKEIDEIIHKNYPANNFPDDFMNKLDNLTKGNPLFVTEILKALEDTGDIVCDDNHCYMVKKDIIHKLPDSIEATINQRLNALNNKEVRKTLEYASVNGEQFISKILQNIRNLNDDHLEDHLSELIDNHKLIAFDDERQLNNLLLYLYRFTHTLIHNQVYKKLRKDQRLRLHKKIANGFLAVFGDELENIPDLQKEYQKHLQIADEYKNPFTLKLTDKLAQQEETAKILSFAKTELMAAAQSYNQYAMDECLEHAEEALNWLNKLPEKTEETKELEYKITEIKRAAHYILEGELWYKKDSDKTIEYYNRALEINTNLENVSGMSVTYRLIGEVFDSKGEYDKALNYYEKADYYKKVLEIDEKPRVGIDFGSNSVSSFYEFEKELGFNKNSCVDLDFDSANAHIFLNKGKYDRAIDYNNIGSALKTKGEYDKAIEYYEKALAIVEDLQDMVKVAATLNNIGSALKSKGKYDKAIEYYEKALAIDEKLKDQVNIAIEYNNIGSALKSKGEYDKALEYYEKALAIDEKLDDRVSMATVINNIGSSYDSKGEYDKAIEYYESALAIDKTLENWVQVAVYYNNIGSALDHKGEYDKAIEYYERALAIDEKLKNMVAIAREYNNIGSAYYSKGEYDKAIDYYERALAIDEKLDDEVIMATVINNIGSALKSKGKYDKAIDYHERALAIDEKLENWVSVAIRYNNIGGAWKSKGEYDKAIEYYERALAIDEGLKNWVAVARDSWNLGTLYMELERYEESLPLIEKARDIWQKLGHTHTIERNNVNEVVKYVKAKLGK